MTAPAPEERQLWTIHAVGAGVVAAVTLGFYALSVHPMLRDQQLERARVRDLEGLDAKSEELTRELAGIDGTLNELRRQVRQMPLQLKVASRVNERVDDLAKLANENGLQVDALQPGSPVERGRFIKVPLRLGGAGTFKTCVTFLHSLRERFPDTGLASVELTGNPTAHDGAGRFVFNLVWYAAPADTVTMAK